jgi:tRNA threonylcarbamoyladenosine biosynthesis protein TsaB
MITLFIDTADKYLSINLYKEMNLISFFKEQNDMNLSSRLVPILKGVIEKSNIDKKEIDKIMVVTGPGSFTGIRMGVTVAKTYAYALNKEIVGISKLELLASTSFEEDYVLAVIDARANYVYAGLYDKDLNNVIKDSYLSIEELLDKIKPYNNIVVATYDDIDLGIKKILPEENIDKIVKKYINDKGVNAHKLNPIYLKRTEAEEKYDKN